MPWGEGREGRDGRGGDDGNGAGSTNSTLPENRSIKDLINSSTGSTGATGSFTTNQVIEGICEGPIEGWPVQSEPLKFIYLDGTPVKSYGGTITTGSIRAEFKNGTINQTPLSQYNVIGSVKTPNWQGEIDDVTKSGGSGSIIQQVQIRDDSDGAYPIVEAVAFTFTLPEGLWRTNGDGGRDSTSCGIRIEVNPKSDGSATWVKRIETTLSEEITSGSFDYTFVVELPPGWSTHYDLQNYTVKVDDVIQFRISKFDTIPTNTDAHNKLYLKNYAIYTRNQFSYPYTSLIGLTFDSKNFDGSIPRRTYELKLLKVKVPSNYSLTTSSKTGEIIERKYTGTWNGTFTEEVWTDNPVWCFYDLITNPRYGLGNYIDSTLLNKWKLYEIAKYCDAVVPDGSGNYIYSSSTPALGGVAASASNPLIKEPRFTCNILISNREEAYSVVQRLASLFRSIVFFQQGTIQLIQDKPSTPIHLFNNTNIIGGSFSYASSSSKARHTVAIVKYIDPTDFYSEKLEYVEDYDGIARYGYREIEIDGFGCTSRGQARRLGRHIILTEKFELETISFKVGIEGAIVTPGSLITVKDTYRQNYRAAGRVSSATSNSITIDSPFTIPSGATNVLLWVETPTALNETIEGYTTPTHKPTLTSYNITTEIGSPATLLILSGTFSTTPVNGNIWAVTYTPASQQDDNASTYKVISVSENSQFEYEIIALQHYSAKYDEIEAYAPITEYKPESFKLFIPPPTEGFVSSEYNGSSYDITVTWRSDRYISGTKYKVEVMSTNLNKILVNGITDPKYVLKNITSGIFYFKIYTLGNGSSSEYSAPLIIGPHKIKDVLPQNSFSTFYQSAYTSNSITHSWPSDNYKNNPVKYEVWRSGGYNGLTLYSTKQIYVDSLTSSTTSIPWTSIINTSIASYGFGVLTGSRVAFLEVYQWSTGVPTLFPSGTSTYYWDDGYYSAPSTPNGWSFTPGAAGVGKTLYSCYMLYSDLESTFSSIINWTSSTAIPIITSAASGTGSRTAVIPLLQWAEVTPVLLPTGTATYTWGTNSYSNNYILNGWEKVPVPSIPLRTLKGLATIQTIDSKTKVLGITASSLTGVTISPRDMTVEALIYPYTRYKATNVSVGTIIKNTSPSLLVIDTLEKLNITIGDKVTNNTRGSTSNVRAVTQVKSIRDRWISQITITPTITSQAADDYFYVNKGVIGSSFKETQPSGVIKQKTFKALSSTSPTAIYGIPSTISPILIGDLVINRTKGIGSKVSAISANFVTLTPSISTQSPGDTIAYYQAPIREVRALKEYAIDYLSVAYGGNSINILEYDDPNIPKPNNSIMVNITLGKCAEVINSSVSVGGILNVVTYPAMSGIADLDRVIFFNKDEVYTSSISTQIHPTVGIATAGTNNTTVVATTSLFTSAGTGDLLVNATRNTCSVIQTVNSSTQVTLVGANISPTLHIFGQGPGDIVFLVSGSSMTSFVEQLSYTHPTIYTTTTGTTKTKIVSTGSPFAGITPSYIYYNMTKNKYASISVVSPNGVTLSSELSPFTVGDYFYSFLPSVVSPTVVVAPEGAFSYAKPGDIFYNVTQGTMSTIKDVSTLTGNIDKRVDKLTLNNLITKSNGDEFKIVQGIINYPLVAATTNTLTLGSVSGLELGDRVTVYRYYAEKVGTATSNTFTDSGLKPSSSFRYWMRTVNSQTPYISGVWIPNSNTGDAAETTSLTFSNYDISNDNNGAAIVPSIVTPFGPGIDLPAGETNPDSTANIRLSWEWTGNSTSIDGFSIYFWSSNNIADDASIDADEDYSESISTYTIRVNPKIKIATITLGSPPSLIDITTQGPHGINDQDKLRISGVKTTVTGNPLMTTVNNSGDSDYYVATVSNPNSFSIAASLTDTYLAGSGTVTSCRYIYQINNLTANYYYNGWVEPYRKVNTNINENGLIVGLPKRLYSPGA